MYEREELVVDIAKMPVDAMRTIRGSEIAMIFQEPMTSLNPVFTVGNQLDEVALLHLEGVESEVTDLPQPLSPTTPTVEPSGMENDTPFTALTTPASVKKKECKSTRTYRFDDARARQYNSDRSNAGLPRYRCAAFDCNLGHNIVG